MERQLLTGTPKQKRKRYKQVVEELGARNITLENIANGEKVPGFLDLIDETGMTMDEVVVLQQYAKAILGCDTKAAEFLRDTVGDKPSTQIDMNNIDESGISKLSLEELMEFRDLLKAQQEKKEE